MSTAVPRQSQPNQISDNANSDTIVKIGKRVESIVECYNVIQEKWFLNTSKPVMRDVEAIDRYINANLDLKEYQRLEVLGILDNIYNHFDTISHLVKTLSGIQSRTPVRTRGFERNLERLEKVASTVLDYRYVDQHTHAIFYNLAKECGACLEPRHTFRLATCQCLYCEFCFRTMITSKIENNQIPVKCCGTDVPRELLQNHLPASQFSTYQERVTTMTSVRVMGEEYVKMVRDLRFQVCPNCGIGCEKISGCNHIVCKCGTGFCYATGQRLH